MLTAIKIKRQNADVAGFKLGELRFYLKVLYFQEVYYFIEQLKSLNLVTMIANLVEMLKESFNIILYMCKYDTTTIN
jgi:hypothetical protein